MFNSKRNILYVFTISVVSILSSCQGGFNTDHNNPGREYAPQMYHSIAYEPYSQITDTANEYYNSIPYNKHNMNMRKPVKGTVARRYWSGTPRNEVAKDIMLYNIPADSINMSASLLKNPLAKTDQTLAEGEALYTKFCSHCHGATGQGDGKVAQIYKGVPSYSTGRVATVSEGHIFHVITYGKGRMWPHGSQINPQERWKIVQYVQVLQKPQ